MTPVCDLGTGASSNPQRGIKSHRKERDGGREPVTLAQAGDLARLLAVSSYRGVKGMVKEGDSTPPSISKTLPVTQDAASDAR